jgi:hypothetical protein
MMKKKWIHIELIKEVEWELMYWAYRSVKATHDYPLMNLLVVET